MLTLAPLVLGLVVGLRALSRSRREPVRVATALLLLALTAVIVGIQLDYAAGGGGAYWRYLIPLTVLTSLLTALGLAGIPRLAGPAVAIWAAAAWVAAGVAGVAGVIGVVTVLLVAVVRSR